MKRDLHPSSLAHIRTDAFNEYMMIVRQTGGHFELRRFNSAAPIKGFTIRGHKYIVRKQKAFILKGWHPWTNIRFFQAIIDQYAHHFRTIGVLLYEEPSYETVDWTEPLDRIDAGVTDPTPIDILTPDMHRTIAESKLFADAMRRIHFGSAVSWKFLAIMLVIAMGLILILSMGGYLG